jgi:Mn-dependent DtxR family transcriptional regulator
MVKDLEKRGLLKFTKGSGTEMYTAGDVANFLKQMAEARIDPTRDPS